MKDYVEELIHLDFISVVEAFYKRINVETLERLVKQSFVSVARQDALLRLMTRRYSELKNVLGQ